MFFRSNSTNNEQEQGKQLGDIKFHMMGKNIAKNDEVNIWWRRHVVEGKNKKVAWYEGGVLKTTRTARLVSKEVE